MNIFRYDFGYSWYWSWTHAVAAVGFALVAAVVWRFRPRTSTAVVFGVLILWAITGLGIMQFALRFNLPMQLPTARFLASGSGRVLDVGAGSGRTSLMVLLDRPQTTVVALDRFSEGYGIDGNTSDRLRANAMIAGVTDRLEVQVGDMREMPLADASFDAVVSAYAIDHLGGREDVRRALHEVARVLKPGGEFLLMVINTDAWLITAVPPLAMVPLHTREPVPVAWRERVVSASFEIVEEGRVPGTYFVLTRTTATKGY